MPDGAPARKRAALFSLSDKTGADALARTLTDRGIEIYATGGTRAFLRERGIPARDVEELTGFPALFGGRVKTLHPKVFGAILFDRSDDEHAAQAEKYAIPEIVAVVVNLYPFEATVARGSATLEEAIEQIDIGGVALLRAAAKNFEHVAVLTHPAQYAEYRAAIEPDDVSAGAAPEARDRGIRTDGRVRRRNLALSRHVGRSFAERASGRARPDAAARQAPALRNESAGARGVLSRPRRAAAGTAARQGALL